jgi:hypothetical protein
MNKDKIIDLVIKMRYEEMQLKNLRLQAVLISSKIEGIRKQIDSLLCENKGP